MIGIYKITNKFNGKSYIGQSIDIKRRWGEHKRNIGNNRNPMYVDFKKYGIDNFSFEVLEECDVSELDEKEIQYIEQFDTYKEGYNLTTGGQLIVATPTLKRELLQEMIPYKDITNKQWQVYYYLLSICHWNGKDKEDHYFIYKNQLNISAAAKLLDMSRSTIYSALKKLESLGMIAEYDEYYLISIPRIFVTVDQKTIRYLIRFVKFFGPDLIRVYALLARIIQHKELERKFTKATLISILGHSVKDQTYYDELELIFSFLTKKELIDLTYKTVNSNTGPYREFLLMNVGPLKEDEFELDVNAPVDKKYVDLLLNEIREEGYWDIAEDII